jgi:hypothetical protein
MLECPLDKPIRDKFPLLFQNVALGSLKSFFQLDHQMDFSLYLKEDTTLCHFKQLDGLKRSLRTFIPISLFDNLGFKSILWRKQVKSITLDRLKQKWLKNAH